MYCVLRIDDWYREVRKRTLATSTDRYGPTVAMTVAPGVHHDARSTRASEKS